MSQELETAEKEAATFSRMFAEKFLGLNFAGAAGKFLESCSNSSIDQQLLSRNITAVRILQGHSKVLFSQHGGGFHLVIDCKYGTIEQARIIGIGLAQTFHYNLTQIKQGHTNTLDVSMEQHASFFYADFAITWIDVNELYKVLDFLRQVPKDGTLLSL